MSSDESNTLVGEDEGNGISHGIRIAVAVSAATAGMIGAMAIGSNQAQADEVPGDSGTATASDATTADDATGKKATTVEQAQSDVSDAQSDVSTAESNVTKAQSDVNAAQNADDAAAKEEDAAITGKSTADKDVSDAQSDVNAAETAKSDADANAPTKTELDDAKNNAEAADANTAAAKDTADKARDAADKAASDEHTAQETADAAKSKVDAAQKDYDAAHDGGSVSRDDVDAAKKDADAASQSESKAQDAVDSAVNDQNAAQDAVDSASAAKDAAQSARDKAEDDVQDTKSALDAVTDTTTAQADVDAAQDAVDSAVNDQNAAQDAATKAKSDLDTATANVGTTQNAVDSAKTAYDNSVSDKESLESQGSLAFMNWIKANAARYNLTDDQIKDIENGLSILDGTMSGLPSWYSTDVKVGADGDATSLQQLKNALSYLDEVNAIRRAEGLNELGISFYDTALAEINADYAKVNHTHSQYGGSSENLAWGSSQDYSNDDNGNRTWPYSALYDSEKSIYEKAIEDGSWTSPDGKTTYTWVRGSNSDPSRMWAYQVYVNYYQFYETVGHYLNLVNPDSTRFGVGLTSDGTYAWDSTYSTVTPITVDVFKGMVTDYTDYLDAITSTRKTALDDARTALTTAQSNATTARTAYDTAVSDKAIADNAVIAANARLKTAQDILTNATSMDISGYQKAYADAIAALETATANLDNADTALTTARDALTNANLTLSTARTAYAAAHDDAINASATASALEERYDAQETTTTALNAATDEWHAASDAITTAHTAYVNAENAYSDAYATFMYMKGISDKADATLKDMMARHNTQTLAGQKLADAFTVLDNAIDRQNAANDRVVRARQNRVMTMTALSSAYDALNDAISVRDAAVVRLNDAIDVLNGLQKTVIIPSNNESNTNSRRTDGDVSKNVVASKSAVIDNASNTLSEHSNSNKTTPEPGRMASSPVVASTGAETDSITAIGISSAIIGALMLLGAGTRHHNDMME